MRPKSKRIFISAGEYSGDMHGAYLLRELNKNDPSMSAAGIGSSGLKKAGMHVIYDLTQVSTIGFIEPIKHIFKFKKALELSKKWIDEHNPDLVLAIDFQGFNMQLIKYAKSKGIKTAYYIPPQEWQWGSEKGGRKVAKYTDTIYAIFKDEFTFYKACGARTLFIGHPLQNIVKYRQEGDDLRATLSLSDSTDIISVFPGSRSQELKYTFPVLLKAAVQYQKQQPNSTIVISSLDETKTYEIKKLLKAENIKAHIYSGDSVHLIKNATLSFTVSGTITLEHAILKTPAIVAFRFNPLSYSFLNLFFGKTFAERVKYISLPNIIMNEIIYPEFLQDKAHPEQLASAAINLLQDHQQKSKLHSKLSELSQKLGPKNSLEIASSDILESI